MDILFLFPPGGRSIIFRPHLGVAYIQAYLKQNKISSMQFAPAGGVTLDSLAEAILRIGPKVVGMTCYDSNYFFILQIARLLKTRKNNLPIILGGPTATFLDRPILNDSPDIDLCVRYDGELTVRDILKELKAGNSFKKIKLASIAGITYRADGKIIRAPHRNFTRDPQWQDLDLFPSPYLEGILTGSEYTGILTTRGCPEKCVYCNFSAMSRNTIRFHSIDRVVGELRKINQALINTPSNYVTIRDDTFSFNMERAKEICRRIIDEKINLNLSCDLRADRCDRELLELMKRAGFTALNFGLESASPKVLRVIKKISSSNNKDLSPEKNFLRKIKTNVHRANELSFDTSVSIIIGLPGERPQDARKTLDFVRKLKVNNYAHNKLVIFPGTELYRTHKKYNLDIRPNLRALSYLTVTKHRYEVDNIEYLNNSNLTERDNAHRSLIREVLSGNQASYYNYLSIYVQNGTEVSQKLCLWLSGFIYVNSPIIFEIEPAKEKGTKLTELFPKLPTNRYHVIKTASGSNDSYLKPYRLNRVTDGLMLAFSRYPLQKKAYRRHQLLFTLDKTEDIKAFDSLIKPSYHPLGIQMPTDLLNNNCGFIDGCRWAEKRCPAIKMNKLIIGTDYRLKTCFNGACVGRVGETRENIIRTIKRISIKESKKRGCSNCPAKDRCSKCLFPYPLSSREYCEMHRSAPQVGYFIENLNSMHNINMDAGYEQKRF